MRFHEKNKLPELPAAARAFMALRIGEKSKKPVVWIADGPRNLERLNADLTSLSTAETTIVPFAARDQLPPAKGGSADDAEGERLASLSRLQSVQPGFVVTTCIQALFQTVPAPLDLQARSIELEVGQEHDPEIIAEKLTAEGYTFTAEVRQKGEASLRGGIIDCWPTSLEWPARIEFFGSETESIRIFDPFEQRSKEQVKRISIPPPTDRPAGGQGVLMLDYLPSNTIWAWDEDEEFLKQAEIASEAAVGDAPRDWDSLRLEIESRFAVFPEIPVENLRAQLEKLWMGIKPVESLAELPAGMMVPDLLDKQRRQYFESLQRQTEQGRHVHIYFYTEGTSERFRELYGKKVDFEKFEIHQGFLSRGFQVDAEKLIVVAERDLCGHSKEFPASALRSRRRYDRRKESERIQTWTELQPGDLVVHVDCGVGRYLGLYEIESRGGRREVLAIEYADDAKLYVPPDHAHLLSRYVGMGRHAPKLHKLGGAKWDREKASAQKSIEDLAASMLETQAARETMKGFAFERDTHWQHEFENGFPYEETADQHRAIAEVKGDMESPKPMDRLLCGDVGYGKTEVAMRAAFKAVMSGCQVAVLVPTTVLAQQHFETFTARMEAFPVAIEMLSRFRSRKRQNETVEKMKNGAVDIVIGTHRLVQSDIAFKNLGLVIIDEEQRFGVKHKEKLKHLRNLVDVLTMTATPIPRTLYMSLAGAKDMSTIQTAPRERHPVKTIVEPFSEELIRSAVLREIAREGQVYMLHNRVKTIYNLKRKMVDLIPEASIAVAHGQMPEGELADVMHRFTERNIDVLLCTTIIESGVDIPNVNTILVDRADRFGLADLYQLRGRVGRYNRQAYAYLLLPREGGLFDTARKRIRAIQRYSSLGSGFNLALRDLEIRGAGNLLGREQSGHIAAVGFDLYCQLLHRSVARLKGEKPPRMIDVEVRLDFIEEAPDTPAPDSAAMLPYSYVEDENLRLKFYRNLAACAQEDAVAAIEYGLRDRFGPPPPPVKNLLDIARLRIRASQRGIDRIEVRDSRVMIKTGGEYVMFENRFPRLKSGTTYERIGEIQQMLAKEQTLNLDARACHPARIPSKGGDEVCG